MFWRKKTEEKPDNLKELILSLPLDMTLKDRIRAIQEELRK